MNILFATSEAHPLVKTGGLGDVSGSLPPALKKLREDVRLVLPAYRETLRKAEGLSLVAVLDDIVGAEAPVRLLKGRMPGSDVTLYLVDAPALFDRDGGPYLDPEGFDWPDNAQRFGLFNRVVVEIAQDRAGLGWRPDVVHCHDWQTGLVPALLAVERHRPATLFTIHNLAYRGLFGAESVQQLRLPPELWSMHGLEFHGALSFIKGGLVYADWITTVSPTYAREIQTPDYGWYLEGLLRSRADRLRGILNGIDYETWSPESDKLIKANFSAKNLKGKARNKAALQRQFGLPEDPEVPLVAHVGRLVDQKGIDLLVHALPMMGHLEMQIVILGTGNHWYEETLRATAERHPERMAVKIGYDETLAHQIEAGADIFLMPSRFEPCGLNQIYSLRYGTVPLVRRTGGLADTVVNAELEQLGDGTATGFLFDDVSPKALLHTLEWALGVYRDKALWQQMMVTGMRQDFSWERSAQEYQKLYRQATGARG